MPQVINLKIETLSPVHLGTGEEYGLLNCKLDRAYKALLVFEALDFISSLDDSSRSRFEQICSYSEPDAIRQLAEFIDKQPFNQGRRVLLAPTAEQRFGRLLKADPAAFKKELKTIGFLRTAFLKHDGRPYIPGSAVKGALRTAMLNRINGGASTPPADKGKELERRLLQIREAQFETDPFRLVKVSDFLPVGEVEAQVVLAKNIPKKPKEGRPGQGPPQFLEVIRPGAVFIGALSVEKPIDDRQTIKRPITVDELLEASLEFYSAEKKREDEIVAELSRRCVAFKASGARYLCRLGRHSGAECVTVRGQRKIAIKGKSSASGSCKEASRKLDHATTLWLAVEGEEDKGDLWPFGWVAVERIDPPALKKMNEVEEDYKSRITENEQGRLRLLREQEARIAARKAHEKTRAEEEEKRRAEQAGIAVERVAMTPGGILHG